MTTSNDPDEIRADIARTRAALSNDVDELADAVRPQNVARRQVDKVKDAASNLKDRVMGSDDDDDSYSTKDAVSDKAYAAKDAVSDRAYAVKDAVSDTAYQAKETVSDKASQAGEAVRQAPETVKRKTQGNPLAAGVIAFGLGMLVSSLIPSTEKERQVVSGLQENLGPVKERPLSSPGMSATTCGSRHRKLLSRSRRPHRKASRTSRTRVSPLRPT
jgi:ABC-type transporter Mla subunit MlaD